MKKLVYKALISASVLLLMSSAAIANQCSGPYNVLRNYNPGSGGPCAALGLNAHQGVILPGQNYITYCDDTTGGRYRTCQSAIPHNRDRYDGYNDHGYRDNSWDSGDDWWYFYDEERYDNHDQYGNSWNSPQKHRKYRKDKRKHRKEQRKHKFNCTQWDYTSNRPCAPGTINRDCMNSCDGR